jgi:hypothetical protein
MGRRGLAAVALALAAGAAWWPSLGVAEPVREHGTGVVRINGFGAEHWHWEYRKAERRLAALERRQARRARPAYALSLAAAAFGVPYRQLLAVAQCETGGTMSPTVRNPTSGASGLFQFLGSTWARTPFAKFSRFDPVASSLAAAKIVAREGWRQWTCRP